MQDYKNVIDILLRPDLDWKAIVVAIAKEHPGIVVEAVQPSYNWHKEVITNLISDPPRKVESVKLVRQYAGFALKEALDLINNVQEELYRRGMSTNGCLECRTMNHEQTLVYDAILRSIRKQGEVIAKDTEATADAIRIAEAVVDANGREDTLKTIAWRDAVKIAKACVALSRRPA